MLTVLVGASVRYVRGVGSLCIGGQVALLGPRQLVALVDLLKDAFVHLERRRGSVCEPCRSGSSSGGQGRGAPGRRCHTTCSSSSRNVILCTSKQ